MTKQIIWDKDESPILITGSKKTGTITGACGDLKIIANAKLTRKQRTKYVKESVRKLDMSDMAADKNTAVKLKEGFDMEDLMTNQFEMDTILELALYNKAFNGKTQIDITEEFLEEDALFTELREELLMVLKEYNGLGKSEKPKEEVTTGTVESVEE